MLFSIISINNRQYSSKTMPEINQVFGVPTSLIVFIILYIKTKNDDEIKYNVIHNEGEINAS